MSNDSEHRTTPPDFGDDDTKEDELMFKSAVLPATANISLSEDDDETPFAEPTAMNYVPTKTINDAESSIPNPTHTTESESPQAAIDIDNNSHTYPTKSSITSMENSASTSLDNQALQSSTMTKSPTNEINTMSSAKPTQNTPKQHNIEITVSDPTKVGDGLSSYMTYRITTKTTLPMFKKNEFSVNRRFSDFLGLHNKIVQKHLQFGVIIPTPPEKDSLVMAKIKMSKDEGIPTDFIDRRRSQLERYLNRLARHEKLIQDPDFRDFIEITTDLPKSTNTQTLSGASVLRAFTNISNQVTKLTTKTTEQDHWFEEKYSFILDLHTNFKHLYNDLNTLFNQRKEAGQTLKQISTALNHLATIEEHTSLSSALIELANVEEKIEQINADHSLKEYALITELVKEYASLLEMAQLAFHERIKLHNQWLHAEDTLKKKRETKTRLEQTPKGADKLPQTEMEIVEWEGKVVRSKEDFERISTALKQEVDVLEGTRVDDFKEAIKKYLQHSLQQQEKILEIWENYLPEANKINV